MSQGYGSNCMYTCISDLSATGNQEELALTFDELNDAIFVANETAKSLVGVQTMFISRRFDTLILARCQRAYGTFDIASDEQKRQMIANQCLLLGKEFHVAYMNKQIRERRFERHREESEQVAALRCLRVMYRARVAIAASEFSTRCTCTRCGAAISKVLQRDGRQFVLSGGCDCDQGHRGRATKMTIGWQFVIGNHRDFPGANLFQIILHRLHALKEPYLVLNGRQVMRLVVETIRSHPDTPQAKQFTQDYGCAFDAMARYTVQPNSVAVSAQRAIFRGLKHAFDGLTTSDGGVKWVTRVFEEWEVRALSGRRISTMLVFGFFAASLDTFTRRQILQTEDKEKFDYETTLRNRIA